jgi:hypothetical protein
VDLINRRRWNCYCPWFWLYVYSLFFHNPNNPVRYNPTMINHRKIIVYDGYIDEFASVDGQWTRACETVCGSIPESENIPKISDLKELFQVQKYILLMLELYSIPMLSIQFHWISKFQWWSKLIPLSPRIVWWYNSEFITNKHLW